MTFTTLCLKSKYNPLNWFFFPIKSMRCLILKTLLKNSYRANLNIDGSGAVVAAPDQNTPGKIFLHTLNGYVLDNDIIF